MLNAQTNSTPLQWKEVYNKNKTTLHTCFPKVKNNLGSEDAVFNWKLSSIQNSDFEKCIKIIENISLHKDIYDLKTSKLISESDSTKVAWYYIDSPWPLSDLDIVRTISSKYDKKNSIFISNQLSTPKAYKDKGVKRFNISDIYYKITKLSTTKTKIEIRGKFIPLGVPDVLAKSWFPKGPVKIIDKIVKLSKAQ